VAECVGCRVDAGDASYLDRERVAGLVHVQAGRDAWPTSLAPCAWWVGVQLGAGSSMAGAVSTSVARGSRRWRAVWIDWC
jgi:hypothetical protein